MEWNKVMNFGDLSTFGTEMADRFVASGANLPPLFQIGLKTDPNKKNHQKNGWTLFFQKPTFHLKI